MSHWDHIQVIDRKTGEVLEQHPQVKLLEDQIEGLQRDIRGWTARYAELKRDKEASARNHPLYSDAEIAFKHWCWVCNHPRAGFTTDRFWLVAPFLEHPKYGLKAVMKAIEGAAYDPWITTRKNGTQKRHDTWELIFSSTGKLEDFANRAPIKEEQK